MVGMKWLGEERINLVACLDYLFFVGCEKEYIEFAHLLSSYIRNCLLGDDVLKIAEKAVKLSKKNKYDYYLAVSLMDLGLANENIGNFTDAIILFHQAEKIWQNKFCEVELAYAFSNEGFTLERLGKYDEALNILQNALELYQKNDNLFGIGFVKNAMGAVNWRMKKYSVAKKIFEETLAVRQSTTPVQALKHCARAPTSPAHSTCLLLLLRKTKSGVCWHHGFSLYI